MAVSIPFINVTYTSALLFKHEHKDHRRAVHASGRQCNEAIVSQNHQHPCSAYCLNLTLLAHIRYPEDLADKTWDNTGCAQF